MKHEADHTQTDRDLTEALARYLDMKPDEIYQAIINEWPEQIAVLLIGFFYKAKCKQCGGVHDYIEVEREDGSGGVYFAALCRCEADDFAERLSRHFLPDTF